jgi:hypothetical protein
MSSTITMRSSAGRNAARAFRIVVAGGSPISPVLAQVWVYVSNDARHVQEAEEPDPSRR